MPALRRVLCRLSMLDLAKTLGVNTVRIFLSYELFDGSEQVCLDHLADFVARLQVRDMVVIVTLFDLYTNASSCDESRMNTRRRMMHVSQTQDSSL